MSSGRPRIILTRRWPERVEAVLAEAFDVSLNVTDEPFSAVQLQNAMTQADALCVTVTDTIDAAVFETPSRRVKIVANFGVGFEHIDLTAATRTSVVVTNTPGVLTDCTADLAMTLLLMCARRAGEGEREVRAGAWAGWRPTHLLGTSVTGKTLGVIGAGRIGRAVARRAHHGFGMKILLHNRSAVEPDVLAELQAEQCSLDTLLGACDFVSLHCPSTAETRKLISTRELERMSSRAILINTARGDVVDEAALSQALERGTIGGAGLDVYAAEPRVPETLLACPNLVALPHLGSATRETRTAMGLRAVDNLRRFFAGKRPDDLLTR